MRWSERILLCALLPLLVGADTKDPAAVETGATEVAALDSASTPQTAAEIAREALEIEARQAVLRMLEADIARKLEELLATRERLDGALEAAAQQDDGDLATLIGFYQAMKPKNAALLLEKLPRQLAADVLGAMSPRSAGKILNVMNADRAVVISRLMAEAKR